MRAYRHYQNPKLYIILLWLLCIVFLCIYIESGYNPINIIAFTIILFIMYGFSKMFVFVNDDYIKIRFWLWLFTKRILLPDVVSAKQVRNKWFYWWGIKFVWIPKLTTIYSVYGLDAVEIVLKNGKHFRIGTDDAAELEEVIRKRI